MELFPPDCTGNCGCSIAISEFYPHLYRHARSVVKENERSRVKDRTAATRKHLRTHLATRNRMRNDANIFQNCFNPEFDPAQPNRSRRELAVDSIDQIARLSSVFSP
jgi:hypothetical protein